MSTLKHTPLHIVVDFLLPIYYIPNSKFQITKHTYNQWANKSQYQNSKNPNTHSHTQKHPYLLLFPFTLPDLCVYVLSCAVVYSLCVCVWVCVSVTCVCVRSFLCVMFHVKHFKGILYFTHPLCTHSPYSK